MHNFQENIGLKSFNIAMAGLGRSGAEALSKALRENRTLLELDVSLNRIDMEGAVALASGIRDNDTLQVFKVDRISFIVFILFFFFHLITSFL